MRAFLRADPDVIMVGEMRDHETAAIGIEASLTGHLVFSTLHTNSAPETITRLLDMDIDPFNFADALLGIMAQRLVRTLCKDCKEEYAPSAEEFAELDARSTARALGPLGVVLARASPLPRRRAAPSAATAGTRGAWASTSCWSHRTTMKRMIQKRAPSRRCASRPSPRA
jgi:type II secretory ATPase GspE/PulE/Tfp pilus assembly ATPase PilB-like protein